METIIRKVGNSAGLILPTQMIKALNLTIGQQVNLEETDGRLVVTPKLRRRYTAAELNAQCDLSAPLPADLQGWEIAPAVGSEAL
jgi:antitoxin ChpS